MPHNTKYEGNVSKMFKLLNKKKNNKGFTLVELVIVIVILAILVGLLAPQYTKYVEKSRKSADASNMDEIIKAIEVYYIEKGVNSTGADTTVTVTMNSDKKTPVSVKAGTADLDLTEYLKSIDKITLKGNWNANVVATLKVSKEGGVKVESITPPEFETYFQQGEADATSTQGTSK